MDFPWEIECLSSQEIDIYDLQVLKEIPTFSGTEV